MKPYLAVLSSRFQMLLQYRAAAVAGLTTQIFFGVVRMMVFDGFYQSSATPQPLSHEEAISYIWFGQALLLLTLLAVDSEVALMIRNGNVAYEMTRPVDLYSFWFARALSGRAAPLLMRALPIIIVAALFFGLRGPASPQAALLFVVSCGFALLLAAALVELMTISLLWTISGEGVSRLAPALIFLSSGMIVPLPLFPEYVQPIIGILPFRGLIDTPIRLYLGHLTGSAAASAVAQQFAWFLICVMAGRVVLQRGLKRLVVQGG